MSASALVGAIQRLHRAAHKFSCWALTQVKGSPLSRPVGRWQGWSNRAQVMGSGSLSSSPGLPTLVCLRMVAQHHKARRNLRHGDRSARRGRRCRASASTSQAAVQSRHLSCEPAQSPVTHGSTIFSGAQSSFLPVNKSTALTQWDLSADASLVEFTVMHRARIRGTFHGLGTFSRWKDDELPRWSHLAAGCILLSTSSKFGCESAHLSALTGGA